MEWYEKEVLAKDEENLRDFNEKLELRRLNNILEQQYIKYISENEIGIEQIKCIRKFVDYIKCK